MTIKALSFLLIYCLLDIEGLDRDGWPGYVYYPALHGWLKLHEEPTDYQAARVICHLEDALLASEWNANFTAALKEMLQTSDPAMYSGTQMTFSDGVVGYVNGQLSISLDPSGSERCVELFANGTTGEIDCQQRLPYVCYAPIPACGQTLGYTYANLTRHCYKFHSDEKNWNEAYMACREEGAHLAVVNSDAEAQLLTLFFPSNISNSFATIGFYYWKLAGSWWTIHGMTIQQAGFAKWRPGEPNNVDEYDRGFLYRDGTLYSHSATFPSTYICEKIPDLLHENGTFNLSKNKVENRPNYSKESKELDKPMVL